jgi:4-amino-4-deoxy-L-arabinose transferase-like glycosyltransferase
MSSESITGARETSVVRPVGVAIPWHRLALAGVLALSAVLNFIQLDRIGLSNTYYAAAVKSMLQSWHNFFFVSFDPGGFVTIDKPPLAFWLQTASAKVFGFSGVSILLPEAIAGVLSVWLLYVLVGRIFGRGAGLVAALALAVTPVAVLVDRSNLVESILVLTLLLAAWAALRAVERSQLRWMLLAAVFIGVGFNVKSLEAYLAAPAIFLFYLVGARIRWYERIWHLLLAGIVMLAVSLSWIIAVDATPASERPYVASSGNNSELSLALGYNGLGRLTGNVFSFLQGGATLSNTVSDLNPTSLGFTRGETGSPGIQRLISAELGGQTSWLLVLALIGILVVAWQRRPRWPLDREQSAAVLWGGWLATGIAFFSIAGFFHAYYLATLAPPIAALAGIAVGVLWRDYRRPGWRGWALPLALVAGVFLEVHILSFYPAWNGWLTPLIVAATIALAAVLAALRGLDVLGRLSWNAATPVAFIAATLGAAALLLTPFLWSEYTVANAAGNAVPSAGPAAQGGFGGFGGGPGFRRLGGFPFQGGGQVPPTGDGFAPPTGNGFAPPGGRRFGNGEFPFRRRGGFGRGGFGRGGPGGGFGAAGATADAGLVRYLEAHQGSAKFLVATFNAGAAEPFILTTGRPVMDLGGFMGGDRILTAQQLAEQVRQGLVRYFLVSGGGSRGGFGGGGANDDLTLWITSNCSAVPSSAYGSTGATSPGGFGDFGGGQPLYDCGRVAAGHGA